MEQTMNKAIFAVAAATLVGTSAFANDAMLKCRALPDASKRLACYDAIDVRLDVRAPAAPTTSAAKVPAAATAAASRVASAATPLPPAAEFGLAPKQTAVGVDKIATTIKGRLESWQQGSRIRLANGQLWQVTDDSRGICDCVDRKVVITRGAFSTYFLEIEGKNNSPRVKRLE